MHASPATRETDLEEEPPMRENTRATSRRAACLLLALLWSAAPLLAAPMPGVAGGLGCGSSTIATTEEPTDLDACCCCPPTDCACCTSLETTAPSDDDSSSEIENRDSPRSQRIRACLCGSSLPPALPASVEVHVPVVLLALARTSSLVTIESPPPTRTAHPRTLSSIPPSSLAVHPPPERAPPRI